jgi:hypothetical protein
MSSGNLLSASLVSVFYDSLTSTKNGNSFSNLAKFTVSAAGPRHPGTIAELIVLDPQNPFKITAQYSQNSLLPVNDTTWSAVVSFEVI